MINKHPNRTRTYIILGVEILKFITQMIVVINIVSKISKDIRKKRLVPSLETSYVLQTVGQSLGKNSC